MTFIQQKTADLNRALLTLQQKQDAVSRADSMHKDALKKLSSFTGDPHGIAAAPFRQVVSDTSRDLLEATESLREIQSQVDSIRYWIDAPDAYKAAVQEVKTLRENECALSDKQARIIARIGDVDAGLKAAGAAAEREMQEAAKRLIDENDTVVADVVSRPVGFDVPALQSLKTELQSMASEIDATQANLKLEISAAQRRVKNLLRTLAEIEFEDAIISISRILARTQAARILVGDARGNRMEIDLEFSNAELTKHLSNFEATLADPV